jgi:Flp pilus assembly protein CpaB
MHNRLKIALIVAVFFGLIAAYGIYNFLRQQRQTAEQLKTATSDVVIAAKDIAAGTAISDKLVQEGTIKVARFWSPG